jgi:glycosyltransferase involved in cell wall biosynthesis
MAGASPLVAALPQARHPEPEILFVTRKWAPATGGMETYCLRLTEALAERVQVIALPGNADGMPPGAAALLTFPVKVLAQALRRRRAPRVLHLGDMAIWPLALPWLFHAGTLIVLSAHGTDVSYHRRGGFRGRLYGTYLRLGARMLRRAQVIANSAATGAALGETGWADVAVIPLATDLSSAETADSHDGSILFAGRLVERKGCAWFVREVLPLLPDNIRLKVAGTSWDAAEAAILNHPRVEFLGPLAQDELAGAYARAMCVIVPNIEPANGEFEGFGLVACEAAACGGVVLAADHAGLREAVIDGVTGFLVNVGDAQVWARKIAQIAGMDHGERAAFTQAAQAACKTVFNWDRVANDVLAIYGVAR